MDANELLPPEDGLLGLADAGPAGLVAALAATSGLMRRWLDRNAEADWGMSGPRAMVLMLLASVPSATMSELAHKLEVTPRAITRLIDGLEAEGYVQRSKDAADARIVRVSAGSATRAKARELMRQFDSRTQPLTESIAPGDLEVSLRLLKQLRANLVHELEG